LERKLLPYIWRHSRKQQIWVFIVVLVSMPVYFQMLQLPKLVVNGPIQGIGYETPGATQPFLAFDLPFSDFFFGQSISLFNGFQLERQSMLVFLCVSFLVAVALNGWFKLYINTYKGKLGEQLLRRLRYELFDRVLRYPIAKVRQVKPSEVTSAIKDEVEPLGLFFGDAFSIPVFLGAQAITGLLFLFLQSTMFGAITLGIVLFQAWIIPRLRRRLLELGRARQSAARKLSGRIGEYVQGMDDVHLHGVSNRARSNIWDMLRNILAIRFELYQRKFQVKFLNNFLIQLLAFLFYLIGGYLVITGRMDLGALVASIAAYKDLPAPIKGIIDWDQQRLLNQIRYEQAIEDFANTEIMPSERQAASKEPVSPIQNGYALHNLTVVDSSDQPIIENFSGAISRHESIALIGDTDSGTEQVAESIARLLQAASGNITLDDKELATLPEVKTGQRVGYADSGTFFAGGSIKATLAETLPFEGDAVPILDSEISSSMHFNKFETEILQGFTEEDQEFSDGFALPASWPDETLAPRLFTVMRCVGLYDDILEYGLLRKLDEAADGDEDIKASMMEARRQFAGEQTNVQINGAVEFFDPDNYSHQLTIGENLIFGTPIDVSFNSENLPSNPLLRTILGDAKLLSPLFDMGLEIARNNVELFGDLAEDSMLLQRSGGPSPEHLQEMKVALEKLAGKNAGSADEKDVESMLGLAFDYCEAQTRFGLLDDKLQEQLLEARKAVHTAVEKSGERAIAFHDPDRFNPSLTLLDNILFGRIDGRRIGARERVLKAIKTMLETSGVSDAVFRIGLSFDIGTGGRNLSTNQAQKLKLARALLKKPDIVIINRALSALDSGERMQIIQNILALGVELEQREMGVICVPLDTGGLDAFDRVITMEHGRITADGSPEKITARLETSAS
jgi:putative ABC transport system ATP-binding protein